MARNDPATFKRVTPRSRGQWRKWLEANHAKITGVWLIYHKKATGRPTVSYDDAVEEALCFGWIDSRVKALDQERYMQIFTPRRAGSNWSRLNKKRIEQVIAAGLMTEAGMAKIRAAQEDGSWTLFDEVEDLVVPADLAAALAAVPRAAANFAKFTPAQIKPLLYWVTSAKRETTRANRIAETVRRAKRNTPAGA